MLGSDRIQIIRPAVQVTKRNQISISSTGICTQCFGILHSYISLGMTARQFKQKASLCLSKGEIIIIIIIKVWKPSLYTNFTGAMSWKLIGLLTKMLKTTLG